MANIYASALQLIGGTPLVALDRLAAAEEVAAELVGKIESRNPAGSVKDRVAYAMLLDAERRGLLKPHSVIIEPTSGNTGIGLAAVAAVRGYRAIIVMPDSMSEERRMLMTAFGAELVLTPGEEGMRGAIERAEALHAELPDSFIPGQFENPANAAAHYETTGPEILYDTDGRVDFFVAGVGTGGTISGTGRYLKENCPGIRVVAVEPERSPMLSEGRAGAHGIQGIGANFIPEVLDRAVIDEVIRVSDEEAMAVAREIGRREGFLVGISGGAALAAAIALGRRKENAGKRIVVILPDSGDRYLSTALYRS